MHRQESKISQMTNEAKEADSQRSSVNALAVRQECDRVLSGLIDDIESLERRVSAHGQVLQSLIAHMAETEPQFLIRLGERFADPIAVARSEHSHVSSGEHADTFVKAIELLVAQARAASDLQSCTRVQTPTTSPQTPSPLPPPATIEALQRVTVRNRSGVWEVSVDGEFFGDFTRQRQADNVAVRLRRIAESNPAELGHAWGKFDGV